MSRRKSYVIDPTGRRRLTRSETIGIGSVATLIGVAALGIIAGVLLDRLLVFDDALDAGGEWDEGGGVSTRWQ
ncbi:MAG: hypothetical protein B7Y86_13110 [Brevundimonas subvibrioides]|uniref:Uncharacterized protein n=1 Tax=Brevundimonas subvibrioides TaxID=74313 RepID=A0A258HFQ8_9CAUL|nr:hypothetical protein [Brevundimonas subvibrioides]OYX55589.1 MAG: hypothetical protein B7Y86_13110 [Brevundimonas subvibrioides]